MKITTYIVDENYEPLMGAHIFLEKDKTIGGITDIDGKIILNNDNILPTDIVNVTYVGFKTITGTANSINEKSLIMKEDATQLNEAEIIGIKDSNKKCGWLCFSLIAIGLFTVYKLSNNKK